MELSVKGTSNRRHDQATGSSPFVPGQGQVPPYLAGRDAEQALIRELFSELEKRRAPGSDLILYGPRGNGKTALLEWARREARSRKIRTLKFSSKEIQSTEWLAKRLSILSPWLRALTELSAWGVRIKTSDPRPGQISDMMARRARRHGLVFAIDEAHTLAVDLGQHILHAIQRLRSEEVPVMLLLAGTPELPRHLSSMDASFWDRSRILPLGLLEPTAAGDAIRIPLEAGGRSIAADALARVVRESHGYPFFLQLLGELLWQGIADPTRPASLDDVDRALPRFEHRTNIYYRNRHAELDKADLDFVAARLAAPFADADKLTDLEVDETIGLALEREGRGSDRQAVRAARDRLHDLGYIWSSEGEARPYFRPGIPSLMQYMARSRDIDVGSVPQ